MTSKAEAIAVAVHAAITVPAMASVPAARVFRDLHGASESGVLPAIAIEVGDESEPARVVIGHVMREIDIRVTWLAGASAGASPFTAMDAARVEVFARLAADRSLGGLAFDFDEGPTERIRVSAEKNIGSAETTFRYRYRTTESSLET